MTSIILAIGYSISIYTITFVWGIHLREQIDELKTRIYFLEEELTWLHTRYIEQREDIKKIKGQFIWNDESEDEE